jgi:hypothetical protein
LQALHRRNSYRDEEEVDLMPLSRRDFFRGLSVVAAASGLVVLSSKLKVVTTNDPEYAAWLSGDRKKLFQGIDPITQAAEHVSSMSPDWRRYLLSLTPIGQSVLYLEMMKVPKEMWGSLPDEFRHEALGYHTVVERPDVASLKGLMALEPRDYRMLNADGDFISYDQGGWDTDHIQHIYQRNTLYFTTTTLPIPLGPPSANAAAVPFEKDGFVYMGVSNRNGENSAPKWNAYYDV